MGITNDEKLYNFTAEAMNEAQKLSDEIVEDVDKEIKQRVSQGEEQLLQKMFDYIQEQKENIHKNRSLEVSKYSVDMRNKYLRYRNEIIQSVHSRVRDKLMAFCVSSEYPHYLTAVLKRICDKIGHDCEIFYRPEDEKIISAISQNVNIAEKLLLIPDKTIRVGGLKFRDKNNGRMINETLDDKLERSYTTLGAVIGPYLKEQPN